MHQLSVPHLPADGQQRVDDAGLPGDRLQLVEQRFGLVEGGAGRRWPVVEREGSCEPVHTHSEKEDVI